MTKHVSTAALIAGQHTLIPLSQLLRSPRNARKTPHSPAAIEAKAASIAAKGILQNLVVEPEVDGTNSPTGKFFVTIGEGRRQAQSLRVERGEITDAEPIPCVIDTVNDPQEISLDENVTREDMHPADQFEAFRVLNVERGMGVEDIAARFGVSAKTVQQRLRLGAVSPRLMQEYRDGKLPLDQLMAFCLTEDHQRQEAVYDRLTPYNREPYTIRRLLTETQVRANDRRAKFVGIEPYEAAGGHVDRDLFTEDGDGYFDDPEKLNQMTLDRLTAIVLGVQNAEGWKWAEAYIDFPHAHGHRRAYTKQVALSAEDAEALQTAQDALFALSEEYAEADEIPDDVDARMTELEAEIARIEALTSAYDPDDIARGGVIVSLDYHGQPKFERGFVRLEDLTPDPEPEPGDDDETTAEGGDGGDFRDDQDGEGADSTEPSRPLPDSLVRELTAHKTYALRLALGEQPELATRLLAHTLVLTVLYRRSYGGCLTISATSPGFTHFIDDGGDTAVIDAVQARHDAWHSQMPDEPADLWDYIWAMEPETLGALLAHCVAQTVDAVQHTHQQTGANRLPADRLATCLTLDMTEHWRPTVGTYLGRITKAQIEETVREAVGDEAANRIASLKKPDMAAMAADLLATSKWLPVALRTKPATPDMTEPDSPALEIETDPDALPQAAE
jgi:ParB family chromosome partitioning protein